MLMPGGAQAPPGFVCAIGPRQSMIPKSGNRLSEKDHVQTKG
jgi:hypothetical protein